jgi:hypothetical protein
MCGTMIMTSNIIRRNREAAAGRQRWLCFYCKLPMSGADSPFEMALTSLDSSCAATAEHLVAQQDGGGHISSNIVAAHAFCNRRRHRCKWPPSPAAFRDRVQTRIKRGRWFPAPILVLLTDAHRDGSM